MARGFDVSASCAIKLTRQFEATGDCRPRKFGGHKRHALAAHEDTVRALVPGDIVMMDNSPPIEQLFANSPPAFPTSYASWNLKPAPRKNRLRKMARRTVNALCDATGIALDGFPPNECFNYFRNAGYGST